MALQFNTFSANSMATVLRSSVLAAGTNQRLRVYGSNVAYPNAPINNTSSVPLGHLAEFANLSTSVSNGVITITGGNTTVATTGAGTVSWFAIYSTTPAAGAIISNAVSTTGGGGVLILNTLTPTSGQNLTIAFSLSLASTTPITLFSIEVEQLPITVQGNVNYGIFTDTEFANLPITVQGNVNYGIFTDTTVQQLPIIFSGSQN